MASDFDPTAPATASVDRFSLSEVSVEQVADTRPEGTGSAPGAGRRRGARTASPARRLRPAAARSIWLISGRYRGQSGAWRIELRIDVDGVRPLKRVSGDFFQVSGATVSHYGSFLATSVTVAASPTSVTITGVTQLTFTSAFNRIHITLPRRRRSKAPGQAVIQWLNASGAAGARYLCDWESRFFRTVDLEEDSESGVTPFAAYDTGALPSGGPARKLSVVAAFAEAGIEMRPTGQGNVIPTAPGGTWSNAELHAAMQAQFSRWANLAQ